MARLSEIAEKGIRERLGVEWRFAAQGPLLGTDPLWLPQETSHTTGPSLFVLFTFSPRKPFFVAGVWVTCSQFRDLFAIRPEIRIDDARISMPQDLSSFAPMGEGLTRLHPIETLIDEPATFQIVTTTMQFYTGQTTKTYLAVMRGWYV